MKPEVYTPKGSILITGGAGFIASHVVIHLVTKYPQYRVIVVDKLDYCSTLKNLEAVKGCPNFAFVQGDITVYDFIKYLMVEKSVDTVLHFAAQSHVDNSFLCPLAFTHDNIFGTHVLLEAAKAVGVRRFIHVSTDEVYGEVTKNEKPRTEDACLSPTNPYSASKAAAEMTVMAYWKSFKFPIIITRPNNIYGPKQYPEKIIPKFICLLEKGNPCSVHGNGMNSRRYLYVEDVVSAYDIIFHQGEIGEIYNIGTEFEITNLDLARMLVRLKHGVDPKKEGELIRFVEDREFNDIRYSVDSQKLRGLNWSPQVSFREGLLKTIEWYKNNPHHWEKDISSSLAPHPTKVNILAQVNESPNVVLEVNDSGILLDNR